jgi:hypothetical protein
MGSVLSPEGIMRVNYHSTTGRNVMNLAQQAFGMLGMMAGPPCLEEVELVRQTMRAMKQKISLRQRTWSEHYMSSDESVFANHLLRGDKSWSIKDFFAAMEASDLSFVSMLDWLTWDLMSLFENGIDDLPMEVAFAFAEMSEMEQLGFFEIVQSNHRLLDVWCSRSTYQTGKVKPVEEWTPIDWQAVKVHFHPQVLSESFIQEMKDYAESSMMMNFAELPQLLDGSIKNSTFFLDCLTLGSLLPLLDGPQSLNTLKQRWLQLRPFNPLTMQSSEPDEADRPLQAILVELERIGYVMLEQGVV